MRFLKAIIGHFKYTPAGKRMWGQCGAVVVVGRPPWTSAQRGIEFDEVGIAVRRFTVRYYMEINEKLARGDGQIIARAMSDRAAIDITIEGEVTAQAGGMWQYWMWSTIIPTDSRGIQNDTDKFDHFPGLPNGYFFMDEATETQERNGWRSISVKVSSNPELHA